MQIKHSNAHQIHHSDEDIIEHSTPKKDIHHTRPIDERETLTYHLLHSLE